MNNVQDLTSLKQNLNEFISNVTSEFNGQQPLPPIALYELPNVIRNQYWQIVYEQLKTGVTKKRYINVLQTVVDLLSNGKYQQAMRIYDGISHKFPVKLERGLSQSLSILGTPLIGYFPPNNDFSAGKRYTPAQRREHQLKLSYVKELEAKDRARPATLPVTELTAREIEEFRTAHTHSIDESILDNIKQEIFVEQTELKLNSEIKEYMDNLSSDEDDNITVICRPLIVSNSIISTLEPRVKVPLLIEKPQLEQEVPTQSMLDQLKNHASFMKTQVFTRSKVDVDELLPPPLCNYLKMPNFPSKFTHAHQITIEDVLKAPTNVSINTTTPIWFSCYFAMCKQWQKLKNKHWWKTLPTFTEFRQEVLYHYSKTDPQILKQFHPLLRSSLNSEALVDHASLPSFISYIYRITIPLAEPKNSDVYGSKECEPIDWALIISNSNVYVMYCLTNLTKEYNAFTNYTPIVMQSSLKPIIQNDILVTDNNQTSATTDTTDVKSQDEITFFESIFSTIENSLQTIVDQKKRDFVLSIIGPVVAIGAAIYNIINSLINCTSSWHSILVNVISMTASIISICAILGHASQLSTIRTSLIDHFKHVFAFTKPTEPNDNSASAKTWFPLASKLVGLGACGMISATGEKGSLSRVRDYTTTATNMASMATETASIIASFFGWDFDGSSDMSNTLSGLIVQCDEYAKIPVQEFNGEKLRELQTFCAQQHAYISKLGVNNKHDTIVTLQKKLFKLDEMIGTINQSINSTKPKPVPVCVYLYGLPAVGKTTLITYISKYLSKRFKGFNDGVYVLGSQPNGHFAIYANEHTLLLDEVGAARKDVGVNPLIAMNTLLSNLPLRTPGADLSHKEQVIRPKFVGMTSNRPFNQVESPLNAEAAAAQGSRILQFEIVDPAMDLRRATREDQTHRLPDCSHLVVFRHIPGELQPERMTVMDLLRVIEENLIVNHRAFVRRAQDYQDINVAPLIDRNGVQVTLDVDTPSAAEQHKFAYWLAGKPGKGKSLNCVPVFKDVAKLAGYKIFQPDCVAELTKEALNPNYITLIILDDLIDANTREGQKQAVDIYNMANDNVLFLVVSNYGPVVPFFHVIDRWNCDYIQTPVLYPAFGRRFGFDNGQSLNSVALRTTNTGFCNIITGELVNPSSILTSWHRHIMNVDLPVALAEMPVEIPFTAKEANLWAIFNGTESVATILSTIMTACDRRGLAFVMRMKREDFGEDPEIQLPLMFKNIALQDRTLKVYVKYGDREFLLDHKSFYCGLSFRHFAEYQIVDNSVVITLANRNTVVLTRELVTSVYNNTPLPGITPYLAEAYLMLSSHRQFDDNLWQAAMKFHGPPPDSLLVRLSKKMLTASKAVAIFLKNNWKVALAITTLTLCVGYGISRHKRKLSKQDKLFINKLQTYSYPVECMQCNQDNEKGCYIMQGHLTDEFDHPAAKGKTKMRDRRMKYGGSNSSNWRRAPVKFSGRIWINGNMYLISDEEFKEAFRELQRAAAHQVAQNGGFDEFSGNVKIKVNTPGGPKSLNCRYWNTGDEGYDFEFTEIDESAAGDAAEWFNKQQICVINPTTAMKAYGVALTPQIIRIGTHMTYGLEHGKFMFLPQFNLYGKIVWVHDNDTTYLRVVTEQGKLTVLTGVKNIIHKLIQTSDIQHYTRVLIIPATGGNRFITNYEYVPKLARPVNETDQKINGHVGAIVYGTLEQIGLRIGSCGTPIIGLKGNEEKFLGQMSTIRSNTRQIFFTICTVDEWNLFMTTDWKDNPSAEIDESLLNYQPASYLTPKLLPQRAISMHTLVRYELSAFDPTSKDCAYLPHQDGIRPIFTMRNNHVKIDTNSPRQRVARGAFVNIFGDLKVPALTAAETEIQFAHLIQPDARGVIRAFTPRLIKAESNMLTDLDMNARMTQAVTDVADKFGEYWSLHFGKPRLNPLTKNDAIWGNNTYFPLKRQTSVGACFQTIFPGVTRKADLFGLEYGEFLGEPGVIVSRMIDEQWSALKRGEEILYPSSLSMKSQTLLPDKLHKKRIIHIVDPVTVVNQRRLFMPVQNLMCSIGTAGPFIITANPLVDWDSLAVQLARMPYRTALDISSFDLTVPLYLLEGAGVFFSQLYGNSTMIKTMFMALMRGIGNQPLLIEKTLYAKDGGYSSGVSNTSLVCSAMVYLMILTIFDVVLQEAGYECTADWLIANTVIKVCGDDTAVAWSQLVSDYGFHADHFRIVAQKLFKMTITSTVKDDGPLENLAMRDMSFCSRQFVSLTGYNHLWTGRLKIEAMSSALCWTQLETDEECYNHLAAFATEFAAWPDNYYHQYVAIMKSLYPHYNAKLLSEIRREIRDQIIFAISDRNLYAKDKIFKLRLTHLEACPRQIVIPFSDTKYTIDTHSELFEMTGTDAPGTLKMMMNKLKSVYLSSASKDSFIKSEIFKQFINLNLPIETQTQTLARSCATYTIDTPQEYSPSQWYQICSSLNEKTITVPPWIVTVMRLAPYGKTKKEQVFAKKTEVATAIGALIVFGDLNGWKRLLIAQGAPFDPPEFDSSSIIEHFGSMTNAADQSAALGNAEDNVLVPIERRCITRHHNFPPDERVLHSHLCDQCGQEYFHAHTTNIVLLAKHHVTSCSACQIAQLNEFFGKAVDVNLPSADRAEHTATGGFPTGGSSTGASVTAAVGAIGGVAPSMLPAQTAQDVGLGMTVTAGEGTTTALMETPGLVGTELVHQTGYDENLLSLALKKMYLYSFTVNVGTAEGVVVFNEVINPWNRNILNWPTWEWANMHGRFYGALRLHFDLISCASVFGKFRIYIVPQILADKVSYTMRDLDALPYTDISVNTTGENYVDLRPTIGRVPATGIYRDLEQLQYGRIIIMTACRIQNITDFSPQLQIRVLASLAPDAMYGVPWRLLNKENGRDEEQRKYDFSFNQRNVTICSDGEHYDAVSWRGILPNSKDSSSMFLTTDNYVEGFTYAPIGPTENPTLSALFSTGQAPLWNTKIIPGTSLIAYEDQIKQLPLKVENEIFIVQTTDSGDKYTNYLRYTGAQADIVYGNATVEFSAPAITTGTIFSDVVSSPTTLLFYNEGQTRTMSQFGISSIAHSMKFKYLIKPTIDDATNIFSFALWAGSPASIKVTGVPLATKGNIKEPKIPTSLWTIRLQDGTGIVPAVGAGVVGTTVLTGPAHYDSMINVRFAVVGDIRSIITTLIDLDGAFVGQLLRNERGIFCRRENVPQYGTLDIQLTSLKQEHDFRTSEFPQIQAFKPGVFKQRVVAFPGALGTAIIGSKEYVGHCTWNIDQFMTRTIVRDIPCAAIAAEARLAAAEVAAKSNATVARIGAENRIATTQTLADAQMAVGESNYAASVHSANAQAAAEMSGATKGLIGQGGNTIADFAIGLGNLIASPFLAKQKADLELRNWKEKNARDFAQRQIAVQNTMNYRALNAGGNMPVGSNL